MRKLIVLQLLLSVVMFTGCPPEKDARDAIAASHGYIQSAQAQWGDSCRATPTQVKCTSTNQLIAAQQAAATALTVYCSGPAAPGEQSYTAGGACVEVKSAQQVLLAAVQNMNAIATTVQGLLKGGN